MTKYYIGTLLIVLLWAVQAVAQPICNPPTAPVTQVTASRGQVHSQIVDVATGNMLKVDSIRMYTKAGNIYMVYGVRGSCPQQGCVRTGSAIHQDCRVNAAPQQYYNWNLFIDPSTDVNTVSESVDNTTKPSGTLIFTQSAGAQSGTLGGTCAAVNIAPVQTLRSMVVNRPTIGGAQSSIGTGWMIVGIGAYAATHPGSSSLVDFYSTVYVDSRLTFAPDAYPQTNDCRTDSSNANGWYDIYWKAVNGGNQNTTSEHMELTSGILELYQATAGTVGNSLSINSPSTAQPSNTLISIGGTYGGAAPNNTSTYAWGGVGGCTGTGTVGTWSAAAQAWSGKVTTPTTTSTLACTLTITGGGANTSVSNALPITVTGSGGTPSQSINTPSTQTIGNLMALSGGYLNGKPTGETYVFAGPSAPTGACPTFTATGNTASGTWSCSGIPVPNVAGSGYTARVVGAGTPNPADSGPSGPFTVNAVSAPTITLAQPGNMVSGSTGNAINGGYTVARPTAMNYTFGGSCAGSPTAVAGFTSGAGVWSGTATAPTVGITISCPMSVTGTAGNTASSGNSAPILITVTAQTITIDPISATQSAGIPVTVTGTYTNGIPAGMKYSWTAGGGTGPVAGFSTSGGGSGTWSGTAITPSTSGTFKLTVTGTATNTAKSPPSNVVTVQAPPAGGC